MTLGAGMLALHVAPPAPLVSAASTVTGNVFGSWSLIVTETAVASACATPDSVSADAVAANDALTTAGELLVTAFRAAGAAHGADGPPTSPSSKTVASAVEAGLVPSHIPRDWLAVARATSASLVSR